MNKLSDRDGRVDEEIEIMHEQTGRWVDGWTDSNR